MARFDLHGRMSPAGLALFALLADSPSAGAQDLLWLRDGPDTRTRRFVGWLSPGPDIDGDGVGEVLASDMFYDANRGAVFVYSGVDGCFLERLDGADSGALFGTRHALIPDRNGDGVDDLIVGAMGDSSAINDSGRVYLYSGATRQVIHAFDPILNQDCLFNGILFPDWNGDGVEDFVVAAPCYPDPAPPYNIGYVRVHSGVDYSELWYGYGAGTGYRLGTAIACAGDTNGDGVADLLAARQEVAATVVAKRTSTAVSRTKSCTHCAVRVRSSDRSARRLLHRATWTATGVPMSWSRPTVRTWEARTVTVRSTSTPERPAMSSTVGRGSASTRASDSASTLWATSTGTD